MKKSEGQQFKDQYKCLPDFKIDPNRLQKSGNNCSDNFEGQHTDEIFNKQIAIKIFGQAFESHKSHEILQGAEYFCKRCQLAPKPKHKKTNNICAACSSHFGIMMFVCPECMRDFHQNYHFYEKRMQQHYQNTQILGGSHFERNLVLHHFMEVKRKEEKQAEYRRQQGYREEQVAQTQLLINCADQFLAKMKADILKNSTTYDDMGFHRCLLGYQLLDQLSRLREHHNRQMQKQGRIDEYRMLSQQQRKRVLKQKILRRKQNQENIFIQEEDFLHFVCERLQIGSDVIHQFIVHAIQVLSHLYEEEYDAESLRRAKIEQKVQLGIRKSNQNAYLKDPSAFKGFTTNYRYQDPDYITKEPNYYYSTKRKSGEKQFRIRSPQLLQLRSDPSFFHPGNDTLKRLRILLEFLSLVEEFIQLCKSPEVIVLLAAQERQRRQAQNEEELGADYQREQDRLQWIRNSQIQDPFVGRISSESSDCESLEDPIEEQQEELQGELEMYQKLMEKVSLSFKNTLNRHKSEDQRELSLMQMVE